MAPQERFLAPPEVRPIAALAAVRDIYNKPLELVVAGRTLDVVAMNLEVTVKRAHTAPLSPF